MITVDFAFQVGDTVLLKDLKVNGRVSGLLSDTDGVQYRVIWWWDGVRRAEWLHDFEIVGTP